VLDPTGATAFSITVDRLVADATCTAPGHLPAQNGHLAGVHLRVTAGDAPADGDEPVFHPADFQFLGAHGSSVRGVHTDSAAACFGEARDFPSVPLGPGQKADGTIVLDVPESTGTIAYRPKSGITSLLWRF
jgi:hypothetical protein